MNWLSTSRIPLVLEWSDLMEKVKCAVHGGEWVITENSVPVSLTLV